jgi:predicted extracellular nuclease
LLNSGQPQVNERGGGDGTGHSNQRCPDGSGGARNTDTYAQYEPTPGAENTCVIIPETHCGDPTTAIYDIQGIGPVSPLVGTDVEIEGVVVGDFQDGKRGFYVQEQTGDGNPSTSDGIFVFSSTPEVAEGDFVRVEGSVIEYYDLTEISSVSWLEICGTGTVAPTPVSLPFDPISDLEAYEGMLVIFPDPLYIAEYYNFDRYGEIVLATERQFQPTAIYDPDSIDAIQLSIKNQLNRIKLDDGNGSQNPDPAMHPNGSVFDLTNLFRGGDILENLTGVVDFNFGEYKIQPVSVDYINANPRPLAPEDVGGNLKVASFNVLNYFTTLGSRGADTPEEFTRQRDKIFAALAGLDADVVGLIEIENNDAAIQDLLAGLNAYVGAGTYAYVDTGPIGTDEIKVAFIYKPAAVSLIGSYAVLDDPDFVNPLGYFRDKNRPALAQTFMDNQTGGIFTAVVNHLKSKGSSCGSGDDHPLAGSCNLTRTLAAAKLAAWLATDPTGSGDTDRLIIGDLNAYDKEDPIDELNSAGYGDLVYQLIGEYAYSYVFDGQLGYLDHALAFANENLQDEITGATVWHINADEPDLIDYDMTFKKDAQDAIYAPDAYRSSDHDPILIGLDVCPEFTPDIQVTVSPEKLWPANHKMVDVVAEVVLDDYHPNPNITLVSVVSNEEDNGRGDGNTEDDIIIIDDFTYKLRAERSGSSQIGRIYTITFLVSDACGNYETEVVAKVLVPHDQRGKGKGKLKIK